MKASLPCIVAQGPVGAFEILQADVPSLIAWEATYGRTWIIGDTAGLHRLAFFAGVVATRRDTVVHLRIAKNETIAEYEDEMTSEGLLDLVLAPHYLAIRPKEWRRLRAYRPTFHRTVLLPPVARLERFPFQPLDGCRELDTRGMDDRIGCKTLILNGDRTTFLGLAKQASHMATCEVNGDHADMFAITRRGEVRLMMEFWDRRLARKNREKMNNS